MTEIKQDLSWKHGFFTKNAANLQNCSLYFSLDLKDIDNNRIYIIWCDDRLSNDVSMVCLSLELVTPQRFKVESFLLFLSEGYSHWAVSATVVGQLQRPFFTANSSKCTVWAKDRKKSIYVLHVIVQQRRRIIRAHASYPPLFLR